MSRSFGNTLVDSFSDGYRMGLAGARNKRAKERHDWEREDREKLEEEDALFEEALQQLSTPPINSAPAPAPLQTPPGVTPTVPGAPSSPGLSSASPVPSLTPGGGAAPGAPSMAGASPVAGGRQSLLQDQQNLMSRIHRMAADPRYAKIADKLYARADRMMTNIEGNEKMRTLRFEEARRGAAPYMNMLMSSSDPAAQAQALGGMMTVLPDGHDWQVVPTQGGFSLQNESGTSYTIAGDQLLQTAQQAMASPEGLAKIIETQLQADRARTVKQEDAERAEEFAIRSEDRADERKREGEERAEVRARAKEGRDDAAWEYKERKKRELDQEFGINSSRSKTAILQLQDELIDSGMFTDPEQAFQEAVRIHSQAKMNPQKEAISFVKGMRSSQLPKKSDGSRMSPEEAIEYYTEQWGGQGSSQDPLGWR